MEQQSLLFFRRTRQRFKFRTALTQTALFMVIEILIWDHLESNGGNGHKFGQNLIKKQEDSGLFAARKHLTYPAFFDPLNTPHSPQPLHNPSSMW